MLDELAKVIAQGFKGIRDELRLSRESNRADHNQTRDAVVHYFRSNEDRDELRMKTQQDFEQRLRLLEQKARAQ
ncbi:MAG TPA: hypothetical protein VNF91_02135 [Candidatus Acidoferrum sp.]|nr:hypothetical protein [Candidatus Acidoferrum sp.]